RGGQREHQREHRRRDGLPHRDPHQVPRRRVTGDVGERGEVPVPAAAQPAVDDAHHRPQEEHREVRERHDDERGTRHARDAGAVPGRVRARHPSTPVQSRIHRSRPAPMAFTSSTIGSGGRTANVVNASGNVASVRTGYTNIWSGTSSWNCFDSMKSTNCCASCVCAAPCSTPTNSTWRKHVSVTTPTSVVCFGGLANTTSAGGLVAYDTTIGRVPVPPLPTLNSLLYAWSHPSTTLTPLSLSLRQ